MFDLHDICLYQFTIGLLLKISFTMLYYASLRFFPVSVKSAHGAMNNASSDLGSSVVSCSDAVFMSRQKKDNKCESENEWIEGQTGEQLKKI